MLLAEVAEPGIGTVVGVGLGTVFFGLICIIALISLMSLLFRLFEKKKPEQNAPVGKAADGESAEIPNRGEFVAAVAAAIAEDLGTDISKIRICSIRKL